MKLIKILSALCALFSFSACENSDSNSKPDTTPPEYNFALTTIGEPFDIDGIPSDFPSGTIEELPILNLYTESNQPVTSREQYIPGRFSLSADSAPLEGTLSLRGRGNSTWDWEKKPYRLKLDSSTPLLGMPKSKHWVLLANYADKTLIRNDIAFMFSRSLGMSFTPRDRHVNLYFNGSYQGVYQLSDQIRVDNDRVDIPELEVSDTQEELISGGYLLEIDFRMNLNFCESEFNQMLYPYCAGGVNALRETDFCIDSNYGMEPLCLKDPDFLMEPDWAPHREYIANYIATTEEALFSTSFEDPDLGYAAFIDVDSAVNYFLINELFKNPDGASASAFLYKQRDDKLFFGPVWDFDLALGNSGYDNLASSSGWRIRQSPWFARLFEDPAFEQKVKIRWDTLKTEGKIDLIFEYAKARAIWLHQQQQANFDLWDIFDWETWYTRAIYGSYEAEVEGMIRWQHARATWIDTQFEL